MLFYRFIYIINKCIIFKSLKQEIQTLKDKNNISEEYIKTLNSPIRELLCEKLNIEENNNDEILEENKKEENKAKEIEIENNNIGQDKNIDQSKVNDMQSNKTVKKIGFKNVSPKNNKKHLNDSKNNKA